MCGLSDMHIAILITNTDFSDFASVRPNDGEKFAEFIQTARPDWTCEAFWVCKEEFPPNIADFDGVMITGSPASVSDEAPWMQKLEKLVLEMIDTRQPLFGACFGHQIIAKALGAAVVQNPNGWGHGLLEVNRKGRLAWSGSKDTLALYGSHIEQVATLPHGGRLLFEGNGLPVAGFAIGDHVFTIQHHPEMDHQFMTDLVEEYADYLGTEVTQAARDSLDRKADGAAFAAEVASFFEVASGRIG